MKLIEYEKKRKNFKVSNEFISYMILNSTRIEDLKKDLGLNESKFKIKQFKN